AGLRREAQRSSVMRRHVYRAMGDTTQSAGTQALVELVEGFREQGIPIVVSDRNGNPKAHVNLPFDPVLDSDPRVRDYIAVLAAQNPPVVDSLIGRVYYGNTALVQGLRIIP